MNNGVVCGGEEGSSRAFRKGAYWERRLFREQAIICGGLSDFRGWAHRRRGFWGSSERIASVVIFEGRGIYEEIILYGGGFSTITFYPKIRALVPRRAFPQKYLFSRRPPASMSSSPQRAPFLNYHYFPIIFSSKKFF